MTTLKFIIGARRAPKVRLPPGVLPPEPKFEALAEMNVELDAEKLAELAQGHVEIAFPVKSLQGRVSPEDALAVRIGLPGHNLIEEGGSSEQTEVGA